MKILLAIEGSRPKKANSDQIVSLKKMVPKHFLGRSFGGVLGVLDRVVRYSVGFCAP